MSDDLIEQMARRLETVSGMKRGVGSSWEWSPEFGAALAREVIRQMEWARRSCVLGHEVEPMVLLSLAPPEWKP